jgi:hypothetical protein
MLRGYEGTGEGRGCSTPQPLAVVLSSIRQLLHSVAKIPPLAADSTSSGPATASSSLSRTAKEYRSGNQQAQQC